MIAPLIAALAVQTTAMPDAATAILDLSERCLAVMTGEAEAPGGWSHVALADGRDASLTLGRDGCTLSIEDWDGRSDEVVARVRDGLRAQSEQWSVSQWRAPQVNESGPTLWTTMVFPDIRRHSGYWVQIIEPGPGAAERLSVSFGIDP